MKSLAEWLAWQEKLHVQEIELGLERCYRVAKRLNLMPPAYPVVTVGGTNGKGSSVAMLDIILRAAGYRVATYTSPHVTRYNERVRTNGEPVSDERLCEAFERVEAARQDTSLTYFEFGTLAALSIFQRTPLDVAVLEVGLGGRLDAVNLVDADVALVTALDIDHVEWLGPDRASIAKEKAGIFRPGRPAVCSDPEPPQTLTRHAEEIGSLLRLVGRDYRFRVLDAGWDWQGVSTSYRGLPRPNLAGTYQYQNAAGVLMVLEALADRLPVPEDAIRQGLSQVRLAGRFQIIPGDIEYVLDVAHNPQGAEALAQNLSQRPVAGQTHMVIGMLKDKDCQGIFRALKGVVDHWYVAGLPGNRGASAQLLTRELAAAGVADANRAYNGVALAVAEAQALAKPGDRVVATGSFLTVSAVIELLTSQGLYHC